MLYPEFFRKQTFDNASFYLAIMEPAPAMKDPSEIEDHNFNFRTTASVFESSPHEKKVSGHNPRYAGAKNMLEVEIDSLQIVPIQKHGQKLISTSENCQFWSRPFNCI